jgi:peptidoglycan/xylan/chitin deacetylase (PgdA/CDA1 family)
MTPRLPAVSSWRSRLRDRRGFAVASLTFDDGLASHAGTALLLARHGLRGTFYVSTGRVGTSGHMTWSQLTDLTRDGHDVGGHTLDHVKLTDVSESEARRQVTLDRQVLLDRGFAAATFAFPHGAVDDTARRLVEEAGYHSGRRSWGLSEHAGDGHPPTESVPPLDRFAIRTLPSIRADTPLTRLCELVVQLERCGGWLPFVFHDVGGAHAATFDWESFSKFVTWLAARNGDTVSVGTIRDVLCSLEGVPDAS